MEISRLLLDGQYAPITDSGGFIEASAEACADWWVEWSPQHVPHTKRSVTVSRLPDALQCLLPLEIFQRKVLFIPTSTKWTAMFDDGWRGTDAIFVSVAAQMLGVRAVEFTYVADFNPK